MTHDLNNSQRKRTLALAIALTIPFLLAWTCSVLLSGRRGVMSAYLIGKSIQLAFPLVWVFYIERRPPTITAPNGKKLLAGVFYGLAIAVMSLVVYYFWLQDSDILSMVPYVVQTKLGAYGVSGWRDFLWLGSYYIIPHTLCEEYYWRWFVYGELRKLISIQKAIVLSGLAFALHHILLGHRYLGDAWTFIAFFSMVVAVSGMVWAWLYQKSGDLYSPWVSHALAEIGLVWIGFEFWRS